MYFAALLIGALIGATAAQNVCTADYCQNGGICVMVGGNPSCACAAGFRGTHCEVAETTVSTTTACDNAPCINGGTCTPVGDIFVCTCAPGYSGTVCQSGGAAVTSAPVTGSCPAKKSDKDSIGCVPAEVVFMIEYARGDSYFDVDHEGDFIKRVMDMWKVNDQNMRIGVVTYHDDVAEVIHIDDYANDPQGLKDRITQMTRRLRPSGTNDLAKALDYVRTTSFSNARPNAEKIVIPFVHMMPASTRAGINDAATKLKNDCVTIIGLGVTSSRGFNWGQGNNNNNQVDAGDIVDASIMASVVTSPSDSHYNQYSDYTDLESHARDFNDDDCAK